MEQDYKMKFDYHIHTDVTDGEIKIEEIIKEAKRLGIKRIAITEHISKNPTYNWFEFRDRIKKIKIQGINILVGVEAKVLNKEGELNVSNKILKEADIILGSVHGSGNVEWLLKSKCDVIAHPQINLGNIKEFGNCNKILEISAKYKLSKDILNKLIIGTNNVFSFGSDSHKINDLEKGQKYLKDIDAQYPQIDWCRF